MEDLPDWFSGTPSSKEIDLQPQYACQSPPDVLCAIHHLGRNNQTLSIRNQQPSGWQKHMACSLSYFNSLDLATVASSCIYHPITVSKLLIWLAYEDALFSPVCCGLHIDPFAHVVLRPDKYVLSLIFLH